MVNQLPEESKTSLLAVLESTSVAFASYKRLKDLVGERFHRLVPAGNQNHADNEVKCEFPPGPARKQRDVKSALHLHLCKDN